MRVNTMRAACECPPSIARRSADEASRALKDARHMLEKAEEKQEPAAASPPKPDAAERRVRSSGVYERQSTASNATRSPTRPAGRWCRRPSRDAADPDGTLVFVQRQPSQRTRGDKPSSSTAREAPSASNADLPETRNRRVHQPPARPTSSTLPPSACSAYSAVAPRATASRRSPTRGASPRRRRKERRPFGRAPSRSAPGARGARRNRRARTKRWRRRRPRRPRFARRLRRAFSSRLFVSRSGRVRNPKPEARRHGMRARTSSPETETARRRRDADEDADENADERGRAGRRRRAEAAASGGGDGARASRRSRTRGASPGTEDDVSRRGEVLRAPGPRAPGRETDRRRRLCRVPAILERRRRRERGSVRAPADERGSGSDRDPTSAEGTSSPAPRSAAVRPASALRALEAARRRARARRAARGATKTPIRSALIRATRRVAERALRAAEAQRAEAAAAAARAEGGARGQRPCWVRSRTTPRASTARSRRCDRSRRRRGRRALRGRRARVDPRRRGRAPFGRRGRP